MTQVGYGKKEIARSHHAPVYGIFDARVRKVDEELASEVLESLVDNIEPDAESQKKMLDVVERRLTEN